MRKTNLPLAWMLFLLTCFFVVWQVLFFTIHYQVSELIDTFIENSISYELLTPTVVRHLLQFIVLQLFMYGLLIYWTLFVNRGLRYFFHLSQRPAYWLGVGYWCACICLMLSLNNYFYPNSFFASLFWPFSPGFAIINKFCILLTLILVLAPLPFVLKVVFYDPLQHKPAWFFLMIGMILGGGWYLELPKSSAHSQTSDKPHIILIGLDSVRPDYVGYFKKANASETPALDHFLQTSTVFTQAYSPLARTYPAWISILTGKYPKHHAARVNMTNPEEVIHQPLLSRALQANGYETLYATDEPRFVDIDERYGFDHIIGPRGGITEFLLAGLTDFPLANLSLKLPFSRYAYPFQFGNRAAAITYDPDDFLSLLEQGLNQEFHKPLLLSIHLCLAHWPHVWDQSTSTQQSFDVRYQLAVKRLDAQVAQLLALLSRLQILQNSIVIMFSDHGTTLGLPHDRSISLKNYRGSAQTLAWLPVFKRTQKEGNLITQDFALDTSYGQGTDVLSLKQHEILFAIKDYRHANGPRSVNDPVLLIDIAPTIFSLIGIKGFKQMDGIALMGMLQNHHKRINRPIFFETADSFGEIEQPNINIMRVMKERFKLYKFDPKHAIFYLNPQRKLALLAAKQRGVLENDKLFAYYPATLQLKLAPAKSKNSLELVDYYTKPFFIWVDLKTGLWSMGETVPSEFTPLKTKLFDFYGDEL